MEKLNSKLVKDCLLEYMSNIEYKLPFEYYYGFAILDKTFHAQTDSCFLRILLNGERWICSFSMSDDVFYNAVLGYFDSNKIEVVPFQL